MKRSLVFCLLLVLMAASVLPVSAQATTPAFAFSSKTGDYRQIFLWENAATEISPVSPADSNAYTITFMPDSSGWMVEMDAGLVEYHRDGSDPTLYLAANTDANEVIATPRYSPDGTKIVYVRFVTESDDSIKSTVLCVNSPGNAEDEECTLQEDGVHYWEPSWSNDGKHIYYVSNSAGTAENIWVMDAVNLKNQKRLTNSPNPKYGPVISPDGSKLAFAMETADGSRKQIYALDLKTSKVTMISKSSRDDFDPAWSADGKQILFASTTKKGVSEIFLMQANGTGIAQLTKLGKFSRYPVWLPAAPEGQAS